MDTTVSILTVFFEESFWVGLYERECKGRYEACKIMFGAEPKDYEVYEYILKNYSHLRFSPAVEAAQVNKKYVNPKRMQRKINKQLSNPAVSTKAQQALKLQHEQGKLERKSRTRDKREAEKERQFMLKQEKRKQKHRGH